MDFLLLRLFALGLIVGSLLLALSEVRHYLQERPQVARMRLLRRTAGSLLLLILGILVMLGRLPEPGSMPRDQLWELFRHWLWVMGVALALTGLALWDALDGVRHLRGFFEDVEREEIRKIQQHLAVTSQDPHPGS